MSSAGFLCVRMGGWVFGVGGVGVRCGWCGWSGGGRWDAHEAAREVRQEYHTLVSA